MPSTYNNALRLEMIQTGEQAGVWGNTTNTNLGTLIVEAIAGYTSVLITATPQALVATDGQSDEARNATIAFTTSSVATDFSVALPPVEKTYVFYNTTNYVATIYNATAKNGTTSAGGTTVAIPALKTMTVWSDGTNVRQQNTHLISPTIATGTLTSPTLVTPALGTPASGTLTNCSGLPIGGIASLGANVGTFLATPSSANLAAAVTDETGSGALVFATSPTLVTPALGTPSSGTLTNCSGLPIGGIASLGTGVGTFLATPSSSNLAAAVTDETGSGSLVFATSPTLVTPNLGTPSTLVGTNISGTANSLNIGGNAGTVTNGVYTTGTQTIGGEKSFTSTVYLSDGGWMFTSDGGRDTGMSWSSDGVMNVRSNGTTVGQFNSTGFTGNAGSANAVAWSGVTSKPTLLYSTYSGSVTGSINYSGAAATDTITIYGSGMGLGPLELAFDYWVYQGGNPSVAGEFYTTSYTRGKTAISGGTNYINVGVYHGLNAGPHILTAYIWQRA